MTQKAPGKHYRKGLSLIEAVKQFSDERSRKYVRSEPLAKRCSLPEVR